MEQAALSNFLEGDYIYYYRKMDRTYETIPARVIEQRGDRVKINGNFPEGDRKVWVKTSNVRLQSSDY